MFRATVSAATVINRILNFWSGHKSGSKNHLSPIPVTMHVPLLKYMFREAEKSKTNIFMANNSGVVRKKMGRVVVL